MNQIIHHHFRVKDPELFAVIEKLGSLEIDSRSGNHFRSLCQEIISQQLSGKVGDMIIARFEALCANRVEPEKMCYIELIEILLSLSE